MDYIAANGNIYFSHYNISMSHITQWVTSKLAVNVDRTLILV